LSLCRFLTSRLQPTIPLARRTRVRTNGRTGVIPLAVEDVFQHVYNTPDREFLLRVSYLEVYNERINDLLNPSSDNLRVYEDRKRGAYIKGLEEKVVVTPEQIFALIAAGEAQRHVGCTNFNLQSSRSHTIFRLVVESKEYQENPSEAGSPPSTPGAPPRNGGGGVQVATLNLVGEYTCLA
jgi:centromeric protein E